jgi:hypothetical protein
VLNRIFLLFYGYFNPFLFNSNFSNIRLINELYQLLNLFDIHNNSLNGLVDYKRGAKVGNDLLIIQVFKKKEFIKNVKKGPKMAKNQ